MSSGEGGKMVGSCLYVCVALPMIVGVWSMAVIFGQE